MQKNKKNNTVFIQIRLTPSDKKKILSVAKETGETTSSFLRRLGLEKFHEKVSNSGTTAS